MDAFRAFRFALCLLSCPILLAAQTPLPTPQTPASKTPNTAQAKKPRAKQATDDTLALRVRRTTAIYMLTTLADEARSFKDEALRCRVQARTADALWDEDAERARALLRRAWEAAERFDDETARRKREEIKRQLAADGAAAYADTPNLRREVLGFAARRDRQLAEEFLAKLAADKDADDTKEAADSANSKAGDAALNAGVSDFDLTSPPLAIQERFNLANDLLERGEIQRALTIAAPALARPTLLGIAFLSALRERNATLADERYAQILAREETNPASDAVAVSLLSSYVLTPFVFVVVSRQNSMSSQMRAATVRPPDVPPALRTLFFRVAAGVLLRPVPPTPQEDRTAAGRAGLYFTIRRLLPSFERYSPEHVTTLQAQLAMLTADAPDRLRDGRSELLTRGFVSDETNTRAGGDDNLEQLDRASNLTPKERDALRAGAVINLAGQDDIKANSLLDEITDADLRQSLRAHLAFRSVQNALRKREALEVIRLTRKGDLSTLFRVYAYTEAAAILKETDKAQALSALDEAALEAARLGNSDPHKARALTTLANAHFAFDRTRTWETLIEATKAANAVADYTGEDGQVVSQVKFGGSVWMSSTGIAKSNLPALFELLVEDDFERAAEAARNFTGEATRAVALLATARAALKTQKPKTSDRDGKSGKPASRS